MARKQIERNISFDEERGLYYVTPNFGKDPETKKQIKPCKTFDKLKDARAALRQHEAARDKGQVVMPTKQTLHQWFDDWMQNVAELNLADTTIYSYKQMFCNHIAPALGDMPLLTPQHLQRYYAEKIRAGELSSNTVRKHHDLLNTVLRAAVRVGLILSNPAERVEPPKVTDPEHNYYGPGELQALLQAPMNRWLLVSVYLAGYLGLRREEICGLLLVN